MTTAAKATKALKEDLEFFEFEHDGKTYKFEGSLSVLTKPGFIRKMRKESEEEIFFTLLELIAGEEALEVIDEMESDEFEEFGKALGKAIENYQGLKLGN